MNLTKLIAIAAVTAVSACASYETPRGTQNGNFARDSGYQSSSNDGRRYDNRYYYDNRHDNRN